MKKIIAILITSFLILNYGFSNDFWEKVEIPNDNYVFDISFATNDNILASGYGMYKSSDFGQNWIDISKVNIEGKEIFISSIPSKINNIFPVNDSIFFASFYDGFILRSTDQGKSWSTMDTKIQNAHFFVKANNNRIFVNQSNRLYYTDDFGLNWHFYQGWPLVEPDFTYRTRMALTPDGKLFVSNEGVWVIDTETLEGNKYTTGIDSVFIRCFCFSGNLTFAGTKSNGIYVSSDNGQSWTNLPNSPKDIPITVLKALPNGQILAGSEGKKDLDGSFKSGLYKSNDNGVSWQEIEDIEFTNLSIYDIEYNGQVLVASNGIYVYSDEDESWEKYPSNPGYPIAQFIDSYDDNIYNLLTLYDFYVSKSLPLDWLKISTNINFSSIRSICQTDSGRLLVSTYDNQFLVSDNDGENFNPIEIEFQSIAIRKILKDGNGYLYIHNVDLEFKNQIYYSKDDGHNWELVENVNIFFFFDISSDNQIIFIDGFGNVLYTNDFGLNWTTKKCPLLVSLNIFDIKRVDINSNNIYIVTEDKGIIKSSNNGTSWSYMNEGLTSDLKLTDRTYINDLRIIGNLVYASTEFGLFTSEPQNNFWELEESGIDLSNCLFTNLLEDGHIYVSTTLGLYKSKESITSVQSDEKQINRNYFDISPNPASEFIKISINENNQQNLPENFRIDIIDNLGNTVIQTTFSITETEKQINIANLPIGTYIIKIGDMNYHKFIKY